MEELGQLDAIREEVAASSRGRGSAGGDFKWKYP
jgi:hypothetical protein